VNQVFFSVRNKRPPLSKFWTVTSVAKLENAFRGDCYIMIKRTTLILSAATLSFGLALAPAALAADAMKNTMSKDSMSKDTMSKDTTSKDTMAKDTTSKDAMAKDTMANDSMKKDDTKKN
jgi:pentapeptide MXKDX repeat protein